NETLGNIAGLHPATRLHPIAEHDLVHGGRAIRQVINVFQFFADVVCIEDGVLGGRQQAVAAIGHDVGQRAHVHAEVPVEGAHTPDGAWPVIVESECTVGLGGENWNRQEGLEVLLAEHGTGAGTATAVRRRERLVQVQVHDVHAKVAGANLADQRVHVGA